MRYLALALLSLAASFAAPSQAQEPPGRVGRLAYAQGTVSIYQDPDLGWDKAYVNTPITSENSIWTDRGSRAELRVAGIAVRLDETTQLDLSRLDEVEMDAGVERGSANIRVRYKQRDERITLETPQARFTIEADGRYRIDVDPERDESRLTVFAGDASMESQGGRIRVAAGSTVRVFGGPEPSYVMQRAASDAFDRWADARDSAWSDSRSRQYVSTEMTGYEDLDRNGEWTQEPDYGALWFPAHVAADWAPYRTGRWSYVRPWGWTWVDDAPWGYAPFHYGRWVYVRNRWGWTPGQRIDRPAWAPALVGWVGGSNWSVGISSGGSAPAIGWYPLAPWERYEPSYRTNRAYTDRLNIAVRDRAPRDYQGHGNEWRTDNRDRGATVVARDVLVDRRPVQSSRVNVGVATLRQQQPVVAAQVQQFLPQGNELIRRRADRNQAPVAAPPAQPATQAQQNRAPRGGQQPPQPQAQGNNEVARPNFARRGAPAPAPAPAPANRAPVQQAAPAPVNPLNPATPPATNPAARGQPAAQPQPQQQARDIQQQQERVQREAQQQQQQQQQTQQQQQQRQVREAQQQQERAQREGQQQREAQQRQEATQRDAQQQQQAQQQRQALEAKQQQERAQREGQQQREAQQRQQQDAAQREAQQQQQAQQQRQALEAKQQQERAQREAQQQQQRNTQQLQQQQQQAQQAAQQAAIQAQQAAREAAQRAAQQAQEAQNRASRGNQQPAQQQPPQAQPQPAQPAPANPAARGNRDQQQRDKEEKDKDKKDKEDKQR